MLEISAVTQWVTMMLALIATGGLIYRISTLVPAAGFVRCPDTGVMAFVELGRVSPGDGSEPKLAVQGCDLWPEHYECKGPCRTLQNWGVWRTWQKWSSVPICQALATNSISPISSETWI